VDSPVSLDEYLDAFEKLDKDEPIENPHIMAMPDKPQQIMTIGLVLDLIACFMTKIGEIMTHIPENSNVNSACLIM
jgi:hypothetical protein